MAPSPASRSDNLMRGKALRRGAARAAAATLLALFPVSLAAQADPAAPARASLEASVGATALHGEGSSTASVGLFVTLTPRLSIGGSATILLEPADLRGPAPGSDMDLRVGYGGLALSLDVSETPATRTWLRVLVGAGHATADLKILGTRIAADNFGVVVPEVGLSYRVAGPLFLSGAAGYRATFGVEDLPDTGPDDLRGLLLRISGELRGF